MRRHAHATPLARRRLNRLLDEFKSKAPSKWPRHFYRAWEILHDELNVAEQLASSILNSSVSAAHACAQAIDRRAGNIVEFQTRSKLHNAFERIANCAKRAPTELRRCLNTAIIPLIQKGHVDLEVIEAIFDAAVKVFSEYSHHEAAKTALAVLTYQAVGGEQYTTVKNEFPGLSAKDRVKSEKTCDSRENLQKKTNKYFRCFRCARGSTPEQAISKVEFTNPYVDCGLRHCGRRGVAARRTETIARQRSDGSSLPEQVS